VDIALALATARAWRCTVADTGIGTPRPRPARPHLRALLTRWGQTARSRAAGGAGLGLAITKWIVEAHGGLIEVDEATRAAARVFTVQLPVGTSGLALLPSNQTDAGRCD
jgi:signal transduction histidine kinase